VEEAARVDAHVASCARCADAVAEARGLIAASSRILTALDQVPSVRVAPGSRGSTGFRWTGRPFATAFVRQRIAAVIALIVVGGVVALTVARDTSSPVPEAGPMAEVAVVDSPAPVSTTPTPMPAATSRRDGAPGATRREPGRGAAAPAPRVHRLEVARQADSARPAAALSAAPLVAADVAAPPPARVTDSVRVADVVAQAERKVEAQESAAKAAATENRARGLVGGRAEADMEQRRYARVAPSAAIGAAAGTAPGSSDARLVQEVRMTEGGQEVWRRIYRVDSILVTLDERRPSVIEETSRMPVEREQRAAPSPLPIDTTVRPTNTIRWRDARGAELTLTGPAPRARLERIRKLLGL
ncbi:MAG TPA: hypothetical protein VFB51_02035, partial [Solirubrobacterales bacterium]|nr:hypothetical protein [Solirubrobacterales bacterium]